ncbi:MAG: hypothetical protein OHK0015_39420 [Chloroflexi bacterium OHK40]
MEDCKRILRCGYANHGQSVLRRRGMRRLMGPPTGSPVAGRGWQGRPSAGKPRRTHRFIRAILRLARAKGSGDLRREELRHRLCRLR